MYAIIKTGGKQYRVSEGQSLRVERLDGDAGDAIKLSEVLLLGGDGETRIGTPRVDGASVDAEIVRQGQAKKIIVFKKKRRKGYSRRKGHRQQVSVIKIESIQG